MRKILLLIFVITSFGIAQTWESVVENTFAPLSDVFFYSENRGWICGNSGTFAQTTDGGQTWITFNNLPDPSRSIYSIYFFSKMEGMLGAFGDIIYKTTDGGNSWEQITVGEYDGLAVKEIYFGEDNLTGWILTAASSSAEILKTTNGGEIWDSKLVVTSGDIESMSFYSPEHGICVGGGSGRMDLYYTSDGNTWTKAPNPSLPPGYSRLDVRGVSMASDSVAYAVGWGTRSLGLQPSILLKTTDGGASWTYLQQEPENRQYVNLYAVLAIDENTAIAGGGSTYDGSVVIKTTDGGQNWYRVNAPFGFSIKAFNKIGNKIWAVGSGGVTVYSEDNGENWEMANQIPSTSPWATFYDGNDLMAVGGYGGLVIISNDRGNAWQPVYAFADGICPSVQDIFFLNPSIGFLARNNRVVSKTTDGGLTWFNIMPDTTSTKVNNYGVQFINENLGYVVGKHGSHVSAFYKTTDGGNTWEEHIGELSEQINDLYFFNEDNGVVVGNDILISYTEDGGATWNNATVNGVEDPDDDINQVVFCDNENGLAIGDETFVTADGGRNWEKVNTGVYNGEMKSGVMFDDQHWILVGGVNVIETMDAGANWTDITDLSVITSSQLYSSYADKNGYLWVTGGTSDVYKTVNPVNVEMQSDKPRDFALMQNYPNPFNPETKIKFSIVSSGRVTLKIFDALGREVAVLINEDMSPGVYSVTFDASKLGSGVYYYRLEENTNFSNLIATKKMILLK
jgi:photosystem II stability/assembly factor-like uncharacterized protein